MNDNTELLTWAVENITAWNDDYTHLRSDSTSSPFYTKDGKLGWRASKTFPRDWATGDLVTQLWFKDLDKRFSTKTLQVITKQEYIDAVNASKTSCKPQEGHVHAALMAEYAEVAKTSPEPWREFEELCGYYKDGKEVDVWEPCLADICFRPETQYRRKPSPPKTMTIGGIVVEACPLKHIEIGTPFFEVASHYGEFFVMTEDFWRYAEDTFKDRALKAGCVFSTKQEAQAVADALNSIYKKAVDEVWNS